MVLTLLLLSAVLLFLYLLNLQNGIPKNFPPGLPRLPIWGSYWILLWENYRLSHIAITSLGKRFKSNIFSFYLGNFPVVVGKDYAACKEILTRKEFDGRASTTYVALLARGGDSSHGLIFADGGFWQDQRRFMQRSMRDFGLGRRMTSIENFTEQEVRDFIDFLKSEPEIEDEDICRKAGIINMPDTFYGFYLACTWSILAARSFTQRELRDLGRTAFRFQRSTDALGGALSQTPWIRYFAPSFFGYRSAVDDNKSLYDFCAKVIKDNEDTFSNDLNRDVLDLYLCELYELEGKNNFTSSYSRKQMAFAVLDGMFPAATGIAHTTNFLFAYLLNYPEIQRKIQVEIDNTIGRSRLPTLDDRNNMPYIQAVIREILRKQPINPLGVARRATEDTTMEGYFIPKDTILYANLWSAHHDPRVYFEPFRFIPERWLEEDGSLKRQDATTITFGGGRRICIGETFAKNTMFLVLTGLLQSYDFELPCGQLLPNPDDHVSGLNISLANYYMQAVERKD